MGRSVYLALFSVILLSFSCKKAIRTEKTKVILIMAIDQGKKGFVYKDLIEFSDFFQH